MNLPVVIAAVSVTAASSLAAADPSASRVRIVSPPDRFFAASSVLDVEVVASPRADDRGMVLRVDGALREQVRIPPRGGSLAHTFQIPVAPLDPPAVVEVCLTNRGGGIDDGSCSVARAAGPAEWQRLRETMEGMESLARSINSYALFRIGYADLPQTLDPLVPDFLPDLPEPTPLGRPIEYAAEGRHFSLTTSLPGAGIIRYTDAAFAVVPPGLLTDREAVRIIRRQERDVATALEEYKIDNNVYPETLDRVVPFYARFLPSTDPYGMAYAFDLTPQTYAIRSLGRDRAPGGADFDADTVMTPVLRVASTTPYVGEQEYVRRSFFDLYYWQVGIQFYLQDHGHLPHSLTEVTDFGVPATDLCGHPYGYRVFTGGIAPEEYVLEATGCDGAMGTDFTEATIRALSTSLCREVPIFGAMWDAKTFE